MTDVTTARPTPEAILAAWDAKREQEPNTRPFDFAQSFGISEGEFIAARIALPGREVVRLNLDLDKLLPELQSLGHVMALTRNPSAVLEKHGTWAPFSQEHGVGLVLDEGLDLRLFLFAWKHAFAVYTETPKGTRRSIQIFDGQGVAVHKIFVKEGSEQAQADAFEALVTKYTSEDQSPVLELAPAGPARGGAERPDAEIDVEGFQKAWRELDDTHNFFGLLRKFGVGRTQAMRLAPEGFAKPASLDAARKMLEHAAATEMPIMIFVGNKGCIEIHTGPIKKVKVMGPWLNILDPETNLHLREDHVASAWVVTKPTTDGPVTSLELFDANGENIALLFGKRKPGIPEDAVWRAFAHASLVADAPAA